MYIIYLILVQEGVDFELKLFQFQNKDFTILFIVYAPLKIPGEAHNQGSNFRSNSERQKLHKLIKLHIN